MSKAPFAYLRNRREKRARSRIRKMESEDLGGETQLVRLCIEAASQSRDAVEKWRRQRRTLQRMPSHLAEALLHRLIRRRILNPSLLEVFKFSVEKIDLRGENSVDAEWMAYIGGFCCLCSLNIADCQRITNSALWPIIGMPNLKELDLSRCIKFNDSGLRNLISIRTLQKLCISETGVTADGINLVSSLTNLSVLDLGGLPVTDLVLSSLQVLTKLQYLDLWGSKISNKGAADLVVFPKLSFLSIAWTDVTTLPDLPSIACLNMSNCTIHSMFEGEGDKALLEKLTVSGATFLNVSEAFLFIETSFLSFLDVSRSSLNSFCFLSCMKALEHLDLSFTMMGDDSIQLIACIGANLRNLNLSNTRVSSAGVSILAGCVPNLETISLSHTPVDDVAISYISMMSSVKIINLSNTNVKGLIWSDSELVWELSLAALHSLNYVKRLDLEGTQVEDEALCPLLRFQQLNELSLKGTRLTDLSLYQLSSLPNLINLSIGDTVLTNGGLNSFKPPATLKLLDLRGCWLLTEDAILSFHKNHPQIEVRHELVHITPSDQNASNRSSPSQKGKKQQKLPKSQSRSKEETVIDQRWKYSREELLAMEHSTLALNFPYKMHLG